MVRLALVLALLAAPAWAAPDLKADREAMARAMAAVDCAGAAELLVGLAPPQDTAALQPAVDALGARIIARFEGGPNLLVTGDAGALRWLVASGLVASLHLVTTARDTEAAVLRRIAERNGAVRLIATTLPGETGSMLAALGTDGVELVRLMETTPQAVLQLTPAALDRLLALPAVCGLAEDRLGFGN